MGCLGMCIEHELNNRFFVFLLGGRGEYEGWGETSTTCCVEPTGTPLIRATLPNQSQPGLESWVHITHLLKGPVKGKANSENLDTKWTQRGKAKAQRSKARLWSEIRN